MCWEPMKERFPLRRDLQEPVGWNGHHPAPTPFNRQEGTCRPQLTQVQGDSGECGACRPRPQGHLLGGQQQQGGWLGQSGREQAVPSR